MAISYDCCLLMLSPPVHSGFNVLGVLWKRTGTFLTSVEFGLLFTHSPRRALARSLLLKLVAGAAGGCDW